MGRIFGISLILAVIVLSFGSLSFGDPLEQGILPTNSSNALIDGQWILRQKGATSFSSPEKAGSGSILYGAKPSTEIGNREFSVNPGITNTTQPPATTEIQKKDLSHFENGQLLKGKSCYHFGKIHLTKNNLDPSFDLIPSLSVAQYKEENPLSGTLEKFKETDIFRSLAILLEMKLNF